eukprot:jgi/Botrbrau1/12468/Bobra.0169s0015.1
MSSGVKPFGVYSSPHDLGILDLGNLDRRACAFSRSASGYAVPSALNPFLVCSHRCPAISLKGLGCMSPFRIKGRFVRA